MRNYEELIAAFNAEGTDRDQTTRDWYAARLRKYFAFLTERAIPLAETDATDVIRFLALLYNEKYSWSTRNGSYTALQAFYGWAVKRGHLPYNPFQSETIERPRKPRQLRECPPFEAFQALLKAIKGAESVQARRDFAMCLLLIDSGMRKMEAMNLNIHQVNLDAGMIPLRVAKGNNQRWGYIKPPTIQAIRDWLDCHPRAENSKNPLFVALTGPTQFKRLNIRTLNGILVNRSREAGLVEHIQPHDFRRLFATIFAQNGGGLNILQHLLGHTSIETTMGYITTFENEVRRQHNRYSPVNFLDLS